MGEEEAGRKAESRNVGEILQKYLQSFFLRACVLALLWREKKSLTTIHRTVLWSFAKLCKFCGGV